MGNDYYLAPEDYEIAEKNGINKITVNTRFYYLGWSKQRAITTPPRKYKTRRHWTKIIEQNGISYQTFLSRLHYGWDEERAATEPVRRKGNA